MNILKAADFPARLKGEYETQGKVGKLQVAKLVLAQQTLSIELLNAAAIVAAEVRVFELLVAHFHTLLTRQAVARCPNRCDLCRRVDEV